MLLLENQFMVVLQQDLGIPPMLSPLLDTMLEMATPFMDGNLVSICCSYYNFQTIYIILSIAMSAVYRIHFTTI